MSGSTYWTSDQTGIDPRWFDDGAPVRAPLSAAMGDAFHEAAGFTGSVLAWMRRAGHDAVASGTALDEFGEPMAPDPSDRLLTPDEANAAYGIDRHLSFTRPLAESSARELREIKRAELLRQDNAARAQRGVVGYGAVALAGLAGSVIDPLNLASAFVPVVGEVRAASWFAQAGSRLARVGVAARIGAIEGAAGAALLEPLQAGLAASESREYGAADTLLNIGFGAVLGGLLHAGGRAAVDGWNRWRPDVPRETVEGVHEAAFRAGAAQMAEGRPVDVGPVLEMARTADAAEGAARAAAATRRLADPELLSRIEGRPVTEADLAARDLREAEAQPEVAAALAVARALRDGEATPRGEVSLAAWLIRNGGLRDDGGDLRATMGTGRARPGLMNNRTGMTLDEAAQRAREAGYFPEAGEGRAATEAGALAQRGAAEGAEYDAFGPRELLAALDEELRGGPRRYGRTEDATARAFASAVDDLDEALRPHGLTATSDPAEIARALRQGPPEIPQPRTLAELEAELSARREAYPEDAPVRAAARDALAREQAGGGRMETPVGKLDAETTAILARVERTDAVLRQQLAAGRITEADLAALSDPAAEARAAERARGLEAAAACLIANGA